MKRAAQAALFILGSGRELWRKPILCKLIKPPNPILAKVLLELLNKKEVSMPRPLRLEYPGAVYHINSRGNHQESIFLDDDDRILFLRLLRNSIERMNWICHAYCLMENHYHLLIEIPDGILSRGMAWINGVYTQKFNRKYGLNGHLFQGRYGSRLVEGSIQFLTVVRYICRNPIEANIVEDSSQWLWSSYRATIGIQTCPDFLSVDDVLACLSSERHTAQMLFSDFVHLGQIDNENKTVQLAQTIYDNEKNPFMSKRIRPLLDLKNSLGPVPRKQRILSRPSLEELFMGNGSNDLDNRNSIIRDAFRYYAYTQSEIAAFLKLDRTTISKAIKKTN
jgi:putative transposase